MGISNSNLACVIIGLQRSRKVKKKKKSKFRLSSTLKKGRIKSSSYGLPIDMALLLRVWVLARIALHALYTGMANRTNTLVLYS